MNKLPIWFSGLAVALLPVVCSAVVVVPTSSSLQMTANSNVVSNLLTDSSTITDMDSDAQGGTVNPLSVSVSALSEGGGGSILTTGDATVTWVDPAQAQLIWNVAWVTNNVPGTNGSLATVSAIGPGDGWTYTFTADTTGFFTLDFDISIGGTNTFGLNGFNFQWFVPGDPLPVTDFMPVGTTGTITQPITAGDSFTVRITNNSGLFSTTAISDRNANMTGAFDWQILSGDIVVDIDIKPGSDPNSINLKSKGKIAVAILTTDSFDALRVNFETVAFGPDGATESHGRGHVEDVDNDGDADLVLHFNTQETGIGCGDTEATLTGATFDGQSITGSDAISTVPCPAPEGVAYDFTQTFGNIAVSGTLTFGGSVPDSITVDDLNTLATWDLSFSTIVPDPVFPLEPFSLSDSDSSWATELIPGTSVQIDATATELVFDLTTPFATNAAMVLMSDGPDFRQFRFGQVNQPGFVGTQIGIQGIDIAAEFFPLPFDAALAFPTVSIGSDP